MWNHPSLLYIYKSRWINCWKKKRKEGRKILKSTEDRSAVVLIPRKMDGPEFHEFPRWEILLASNRQLERVINGTSSVRLRGGRIDWIDSIRRKRLPRPGSDRDRPLLVEIVWTTDSNFIVGRYIIVQFRGNTTATASRSCSFIENVAPPWNKGLDKFRFKEEVSMKSTNGIAFRRIKK